VASPFVTTVERALGQLPDGARVVATPGCGAPTTLLAGLGELAARRSGLHLYSGLQLDDQPFLPAVEAGGLRHTTWHVTAATRELVAAGVVDHLPARLSDVPTVLPRLGLDATLVRVSPPAADGRVSLGPSMSYSRAAVETAPLLIGEIDETLPRTAGPTLLPVERFAALVDSARATPVYRGVEPDARARSIARYVLELLPDAPTLQLGIGQIPEAIGRVVHEEGVDRLRFVGLCTDTLVDLAEDGRLEQLAPTATPPVAAVELMGSRRLMRFADRNPDVALYPSERGHDPGWLAARFDRLVSVNSAIEVDLSGQVNAETVADRRVSSIGGAADFVDAARASRDGMSLVALPSTAQAGTVSRIVDRLPAGAATTIPAHAHHAVVTEHGVADLRGRTTAERAEALIGVAAPEHRDTLQRAWRR
jgi:4-hydroxybutyrate CoA-transferase